MVNYKTIICEINKKESGKRLDIALTSLTRNLSRTKIKYFLVNGNIKKSNIEFSDPSYKVKEGEKFEITIPLAPKNNRLQPQNIPINIVFEDNDLIIIDKQSGIVVHPAPGNENNTLVNALLYHKKFKLNMFDETNRPGIVHRIDKETSGLLVVAKNEYSHNKLSKQFKEHSIKRKYQALVWGFPNKKIIKGYIGRNRINRKKMSLVDKRKGKYSETSIKIKKNFNICSLIECELSTGRTHQIRVHLDSIGNPIVGDKIYGKNKSKNYIKNNLLEKKIMLLKNFNRHALHAYFLGFCHPVNNKYIEFESDLPADFLDLLNYLSRY